MSGSSEGGQEQPPQQPQQLPQPPQSWTNPGGQASPQDAVPPGYTPPGYAGPPSQQQPQQWQQPGAQPQPQWQQQWPQQGRQQWQQPYAPYPPQRPGGLRGSGAKVAIIGSAVGVVVIALVVVLLVVPGSRSGRAPSALVESASPVASTTASGAAIVPSATAPSPLASCTPASSLSDEPVGYQPCGTAARNVGIPIYNAAVAHKTYTVTIKTNRGDVVFTADGAAAPYTVDSFVYLVQKQYFDNTPCHRLTTTGIYVLQCGDPTGTGSGGPGYEFQDENLASLGTPSSDTVVYHAGTVAMANAGPDTNGSQFFLVYKDSPIAPDYTPFGTITHGMSVLQQIAAAGTDNANSSGDGAPLEAVRIESVTVQ